MPAGTTAQQPSGVNGMIRYNSSDERLEAFENSAWGILGGAGIAKTVLIHTAAGDVTVAVTDHIIVVNKTSGAATAVNLPAGSTVDTGKIYIVKDGKGDAGTNNITIDGDSAETIDGQTTRVINQNYEATTVVWNGTEWNII